ncbi:carotenoid-cleaving dioxygenase, mitochondrial [Halyomorpha halys]|uniref:carotenoid-cleaving dioxygenase, mitochondrial n=1 Tax=Halyomorpha halys TaxID=286706 RepID=UPI0006D4E762|nr:beta,beta-carotene 9',10'-oxygenase-like [Halyomorpha halys]
MVSYAKLFRTTEEQVQPIEASVLGIIPEWLTGSYIRAGPAIFDGVKGFTVNHWCDGFAVVYKFEIHKGKVTFSKRFVASDAYRKFNEVGKPVYTELGTKAHTDTSKNIFQKIVSNMVPELTDNVGNNIFKLGNTIYLSTESSTQRILDPNDLSTNKKVNAASLLKVNLLCSHVLVDEDGTAYTIGSAFSNGFKCQIIKIPKPSNQTVVPGLEYSKGYTLATLDNKIPKFSGYHHSFGMSKRWIIYIEQPLFMNNMKMMTAYFRGRTLLECMEWIPHEKNRFFLIDKVSGEIKPIIYESQSAFFFLHISNAYEDNGELIIDLIGHDSSEILTKLHLKYLRNADFSLNDKASARRYILPLVDNLESLPEKENLIKRDKRVSAMRIKNKIIVNGAILTEPNFNLPNINPAFFCRKYKYFYATGLFGLSVYRACIVKVNVETGEVLTWKENDDAIPGEPVFVANPRCQDEDGGILLAGVTDLREGQKDFLVVIDAKTMVEVARAEVEAHVPHLFHGIFLPSDG